MNPSKVVRSRVKYLTDLPNVGPAGAEDLRRIGIFEPIQLVGKNPLVLYETLCEETGTRHDPCVIDIFISVTRFMDGDEPRPWWDFTNERKRLLGAK
jgi:hypothetical protein